MKEAWEVRKGDEKLKGLKLLQNITVTRTGTIRGRGTGGSLPARTGREGEREGEDGRRSALRSRSSREGRRVTRSI